MVKAANKIKFGGASKSLYQAAMRSSCVLLTFANFENYVSDSINDFCKGFCNAKLPAAKIPAELRSQVSVIFKLNEWSDIEDPSKLHANIWLHKSSGGFSILEDGFLAASINVDSLIAKAGYPKFDNVVKVMRRVGISDPKIRLRQVGGHSIGQKLTSFHDARAELAHTGKLPLWSTQDYLDRLDDLEAFANAVDRCLCNHFCSFAKLTHWIV